MKKFRDSSIEFLIATDVAARGIYRRGERMAKEHSFDIVSEVNLQEVDNAINQAVKEISTRYDFKGSKSSKGTSETVTRGK